MNTDELKTIPRVHSSDVYVIVVRPDGEQRAIRCESVDQCLDVVQVEGIQAQRWTIIQIVARRGSEFVPLARWGKDKKKLVRLGYNK